ncbi:MAG TPA: acyl-CoA dehydrogenase family protein, partial [Iamia sp.]|nr:acyl-CoA dehydrogenase family protein [Iamia sp.]
MDLTLTDEQELIRDSVAKLLAKLSGPEQVREAEATGHDPALWDALVTMGIPAMTLPEAVGGGGSTLAALGVALEECGAALATAPLVEVAVAGRALAALGQDARAAAVAEGAVVVASPRSGRTLVPGAGAASSALVLDSAASGASAPGGSAVLVVHDQSREVGVDPWPTARSMASIAAADVPADAWRVVLATGAEAVAAHARLAAEWRALTAASLVGLAQRALDIGIRYATERKQFGVPIGTFQALQHQLADVATDVEGARLVARKALWALDNDEPEAAAFPAIAFALAARVAQRASAVSLHVHGGYGFMEEYDIQLYFRRAKATRLLLGDPRDDLLHVADRCFGPVGAPLPDAASVVLGPLAPDRRPERDRLEGLEFRLPAEVEAFRADARAFLAQHVTEAVIERAHTTGTIHDWGLHRAMAEGGWISAG